jgi:DNA-binding transcriptional regulator YdaS (Cro superfamily)
MTPEQALAEAVRIVGSKQELADRIGVSRQAVSQWRRCPVKHAVAVERAVRAVLRRAPKLVTRYELRPDKFRRRTD